MVFALISSSPKHGFLRQPDDEDLGSQDFWDNVVRINRDEYRPTTVGEQVHASLKRKRLLVGGLGSGKTRNALEHLNQLALAYPGSHHVIARKDLGDLRRTTQLEFLEKVIEPKTIDRFLINENTLYYGCGSRVFFMECKTPSNFKSMEIVSYLLDEADENEEGQGKDRLLTMLDGRCRQKIKINGSYVPVPYCGLIVYNPTTDDHWLAKLEDHPEPNMGVFRSSTYDNAENLPPDYIPNLLSSLAPWEIESLVYGKRAQRPKGRPVIHGFSRETHVRELEIYPDLPIRRSWDFGFNHPCVSIGQYDPVAKRFLKIREFAGQFEQLPKFAPRVVEFCRKLAPAHQFVDTGDPHGKDQKDVGDSSIEHLRIYQGICLNVKRQTLKTGLDELQEMVLSKAPYRPPHWVEGDPVLELPRLLVDPSCEKTIAAYLGGYFRDAEGKPQKDDVHDHYIDSDRYNVVHTMNLGLVHRHKKTRRYIPRNSFIGV